MNRNRRAVSLTEILIAVGVLAVAIVGISRMVSSGSRLSTRAMSTTVATQLLNGIIEECRSVPIRLYQPTGEEWTDVPESSFGSFFPKTLVDIRGVTQVRSMSCRLCYKLVGNAAGQVAEVWVRAQIDWQDTGNTVGGQAPVQTARTGAVLVNTEAM